METVEKTSETVSATPPWEAKPTQRKRGLFRKVLMWAFLLGIVGVIIYGLMPKPIDVELGQISRGALTVHVVEEGKTRVRNRYILSAPVAGHMRRVVLKAGDMVKANETVLTTIEPSQSPLLDSRAVVQAQARVDMMEAAQQRAAQSLELAKTAAEFAQSNWERLKKIASSGSVSAVDRDNAERDASLRTREVNSAQFAVQVSQYELAQAKAALQQFSEPQSNVSVEVRAPVSGKVLKVMQESSMVVGPGTQILEIGDPSDIEIEAEILSRDAVAIKPGAMVSVEQWGGDAPLEARVRLVEPAAFTKVSALGVEEQRVIVLSDLVDPPVGVQALGDRYRVEVRVATWHSDDVLLIPAGALFREGNAWKTFVFDGHKAKQVTLETGHSDGRMTEILKGLEVGAQVLMHPPDNVKDGVAVKKREG